MNRIDRGRRTLLQAGSATLAATVTGCVGGSDGDDSAGSGQESATVSNGANAPDYASDPAAIRVDGGTKITWEWLNAVAHSVTHRDREFNSGLRGKENSTFSHTFDGAGTYLYYCVPHKSIGQNGAVIVE